MDNQQQIEQWFVQYKDDIYNYLVYYTGRYDVEDIVQDVFMKAMKGVTDFDSRATPKTWLFSIARHSAINEQRRKQLLTWLPSSLIHTFQSKDKTPEQFVELQDEVQHLYTCMNRLKKSYRDILLLRGIKGFSVTESAEILNWSEKKVHLTLHRALKAMKKVMLDSEEGCK